MRRRGAKTELETEDAADRRRVVITPHAVAGAAAGRDTHPVVSFAAGFVSHFALDKIPHRDYSLAGRAGKLRALADMTVAGALIAASGGDRVSRFAGGLGGIAPDLLCVAGRNRSGLLDVFVGMHDRSHTKLSCGRTASRLVQSATVAAAFALLRSGR